MALVVDARGRTPPVLSRDAPTSALGRRQVLTSRSQPPHAPHPHGRTVRSELLGGVLAVLGVVLAEVRRALLSPPVGVLLDELVEQLLDAVAVRYGGEDGGAALAGG